MSQLSKVISLVYRVHFSAVLRYLQGFEMCVAGVQPENWSRYEKQCFSGAESNRTLD